MHEPPMNLTDESGKSQTNRNGDKKKVATIKAKRRLTIKVIMETI